MDLTWRDAVSTFALVIMLVVYVAYLTGSFWLISSTWAAAAVLLLVGLGGRVVSVGGKAIPSAERFHQVLRITATVFGIIALLAGISALVLSSAFALKILIMTSIIVWLATVVSHI